MRNVYLLIPEGTTFDGLTEEQQAGINSIFGQYVMPQHGTRVHNGKVVCDALCKDTFDPELMGPLGLVDWEIIGMWSQIDGEFDTIVPLNENLYEQYLADVIEYNEQGEEIGSSRPALHQPHRWAGWESWTD